MSTFYIGAFIGFLLGTFAGIILTAIMVAARDESDRILGEPDFPRPPAPKPQPEQHKIHYVAYKRGRCACREHNNPNPYPEGSVPWHSWNKGWNDQLEGVKPE